MDDTIRCESQLPIPAFRIATNISRFHSNISHPVISMLNFLRLIRYIMMRMLRAFKDVNKILLCPILCYFLEKHRF